MFKELNDRKISEEFNFFEGGRNIGILNESNENFSDYLLSHFAREVLSKNKMKIHLDTRNIYYNNLNMTESIYSFMSVQEDEIKSLKILFRH